MGWITYTNFNDAAGIKVISLSKRAVVSSDLSTDISTYIKPSPAYISNFVQLTNY